VLTVVCVLLFLAVNLSAFFGLVLFSFVGCVVPTVLIICVIYGRGDVRAFSIGALVPWVVSIALRFPDIPGGIGEIIWLLVMGAVCGGVAAATRRWIEWDRG
jgi:hypothetical protein